MGPLRKALAGRVAVVIAVSLCVMAIPVVTIVVFRESASAAPPNRSDGLAAWQAVYSVMVSPRCVNCHTATDYPQQGDDRHRHFANVIRGLDGHGVPGLNCGTCHQSANAALPGVPGAHDWHLAPLSMRWQDIDDRILSSAAVCATVTDRTRNGGLNGPGLLKHHQQDALVMWAWAPGRELDGKARSLPPITHEQFAAATRRWVEAGMPCPNEARRHK
jgi:hypothetical protein